MSDYFWSHNMVNKASLPQAVRFLPYAKTSFGEKAKILVDKLTTPSVLIILAHIPHDPCTDPARNGGFLWTCLR